MKLLICTQAVDTRDPILGFFVRWIEEFAKHCEDIEVICLREGTHSLPNNVRVHPLRSKNKIGRALELWKLCVTLSYDKVFVHMNPEYLVAAGLLWKALGKRVALWYTHKSVNMRLRIAAFFADVIFTASKESFRLKNTKVRVVGHGIDIDFFRPDPSVTRGNWALSVGRLSLVKRHDEAIRKAKDAGVALHIAGDGPERENLKALARELDADVQFLGSLSPSQLRDEYRRSAYLIHTSETGSLDKVILEALACGLRVQTSNPTLKPFETMDLTDLWEHHSLARLVPLLVSF